MNTYRDDNGIVDLTIEYAPSTEGTGGVGSFCSLYSLSRSVGFDSMLSLSVKLGLSRTELLGLLLFSFCTISSKLDECSDDISIRKGWVHSSAENGLLVRSASFSSPLESSGSSCSVKMGVGFFHFRLNGSVSSVHEVLLSFVSL